MSGGTTPRGWYPDPATPGQERWWDGVTWTNATRPTPQGYAPPPPPPPPPGYGSTLPPPPGFRVGYGPGAPSGPPPNNYLAPAIITTLMCCMPLGIVAIVKSTQVERRWVQGDEAGAQRASEAARNWSIASAIVGVLFVAFFFVVAGRQLTTS